ncbi:MAG: hypothetical protein ACD_20C00429G0023 [uncultured bacterium]|nr:MAG: hypothetical protein ACD_20C00429G0023 [uncultured bacterium]
MNILAINVALRPYSPVKIFPVGLGYVLTSIKQAGFDFDLIDIDLHRYTESELKRLILKKKYDVVCMGCIVTGYSIIKSLTSLIRECHPNAKIIVGNTVASSIHETLLSETETDIAILGEADITIVELIDALINNKPLEEVGNIAFVKNGKIIKTHSIQLIKDISSLPFIDFSIFEVEEYIKNCKTFVKDSSTITADNVRGLPVNTARGCIADCSFCYHIFKGKKYRYRSPESIVMEIKALIDKYSLNYIFFWDELTFFSKKQAYELAKKILDEKLKFYWHASCRADLFKEEEDLKILQTLKEAGCVGLGFALESSDQEILKAMNKHITVEDFSRQTKLVKQAGLEVWTSIVLGYPQETSETIKKTYDCCIENDVYPSTGYLLPQPGSVMYAYALENGFICNEEEYLLKMGDRQDLRLNMTKMGNEEFESCVIENIKRCNMALNIQLDQENLIKTQNHRVSHKN